MVLERCSLITSNSIVGAGSIVTKNIDTKGVYAGIPARFIHMLSETENEDLLLDTSMS